MKTNAINSSRREESPISVLKGIEPPYVGCYDVMGWLPLMVLAGIAFGVRCYLPTWGFMWAIAFGIFFGCKWLTWWRCETKAIEPWRNWAYLFLWPGLDAATFLSDMRSFQRPGRRTWIGAFSKTLFGAVLLWGMVQTVPASSPLVAGWCGLLGLIFVLHFGAFHLLALGWQSAGVNAEPLMRAPVLATSLGEFWGGRWNSAFSGLAHDIVFRPVRRRFGVAAASFAVFLVSGLVHEVVISVPARGGYGLPTLYFLLQAAGMMLERSTWGRRVGLRRGLAGWIFTAVFTAGPAFWLFHPPFILRVIIPFLNAIHAM